MSSPDLFPTLPKVFMELMATAITPSVIEAISFG
jgi:hypothetical protein